MGPAAKNQRVENDTMDNISDFSSPGGDRTHKSAYGRGPFSEQKSDNLVALIEQLQTIDKFTTAILPEVELPAFKACLQQLSIICKTAGMACSTLYSNISEKVEDVIE
jgi:hypothetical protein